MYKHILFPTDGEAPSVAAIAACVALAKDAGALLTVLHVRTPFHFLSAHPAVLSDTPRAYAVHSQQRAEACLEQVAAACRAQGVAHETVSVEHELPSRAIVDVARERGCDLVAMASHGRRGVQALFIGSETQKVLASSPVPVLVFR